MPAQRSRGPRPSSGTGLRGRIAHLSDSAADPWSMRRSTRPRTAAASSDADEPDRPRAARSGVGAYARTRPHPPGRRLHLEAGLRLGIAASLRGVVGVRRAGRRARGPGRPARLPHRARGILLVRALDGELRGFYNTCRHRGHELLEPGRRGTCGRSSARTTRGSIDSTARSVRRLGSATSPASTEPSYPLVAARIAGVAWVGVRERGRTAPVSTSTSGTSTTCRAVGARSACSWPRRTTTRSRPTGRRSPRTTTSATTAPRSTRRSAT